MYGNFQVEGPRVFSNCYQLKLNKDRIYSQYPVLQYPVPFINDNEACNIVMNPLMNSAEELFSGCVSLSGNDFSMIMLSLTDNITSLNKMFTGCDSIDAEIPYDLFRHCPNVTNITSFAEGTSIKGGIYSRTSNYDEDDTTTYGTFDFLKNIEQASYAFSGTDLQYIDNNVFAPLDG